MTGSLAVRAGRGRVSRETDVSVTGCSVSLLERPRSVVNDPIWNVPTGILTRSGTPPGSVTVLSCPPLEGFVAATAARSFVPCVCAGSVAAAFPTKRRFVPFATPEPTWPKSATAED